MRKKTRKVGKKADINCGERGGIQLIGCEFAEEEKIVRQMFVDVQGLKGPARAGQVNNRESDGERQA